MASPKSPKQPKPPKLSPKKIKALDLIMSGVSLADAARQLSISRQTLSLWKNQDQLFQQELERLREDAIEHLHESVPAMDAFMLSQLREIAQSGPYDIRLKAVQWNFERPGRLEPQIAPHALLSQNSGAQSPLLAQALNALRNKRI